MTSKKRQDGFAQRLAHQDAVTRRLSELAADEKQVSGELSSAQREVSRLNERISTIQAAELSAVPVGAIDSVQRAEPANEDIRAARQQVDEAKQRIMALEEKRRAIRDDRAPLLEEGKNLEQAGASEADVIAHQEELQRARAAVSHIETLIEAEETALRAVEAEGSDDRIEGLQRQREEILADIALGQRSSGEIAKIDDQLSTLLKDEDGREAGAIELQRQTYQTLAGLRRRGEKAQAEVQRLEKKTPAVAELFLRDQASRAAEAYLEHAQAAVSAIRRIYALDRILQGVLGSRSPVFLRSSVDEMQLPALLAPCFEGVQLHDERHAVMFSASGPRGLNADDEQAERRRLRKMGLTVPL